MISWLFSIGIGLLSYIFIARVSVLEMVAMVWLLILVIGKPSTIDTIFSRKNARVGFCLISAFFLLLSDIINESSFGVLIKGAGAFVLFPVGIIFLVNKIEYNKMIMISFASSLSSFFLNKEASEFSVSADNFKFGYAGIAISFTLFLFSYIPQILNLDKKIINYLDITIVFLLMGLSSWGNLRLLSLIGILSYIVSHYYIKLSQCLRLTNLTPIIASFCFPAVILFISIGLSKVFSVVLDLLTFLPPGIISDDAITKTRQQFNGSFGLLFGGRQELFSSFFAWQDKWLFGWGSWAQDPNSKYRYIGYETMSKLGYDFDFEKEFKAVELGFTSTFIPTHSVILSLLAWGGTLSTVPFYIFLSNYISQYLRIISQMNLSPPFFISYAFINSLWNITFSPFGFTNRLGIAISCALVISYSKKMYALHHKTLTMGAINL
jgi:hypothetical protein